MPETEEPVRVDAKTFQEPLAFLVETMVQKVHREGTKHAGLPATVSDDFAMMLRYSVSIYRLLYYLNADVRRANDEDWHMEYGVSAMSLVRSLIDCLYNVTAILQNPRQKGAEYRMSGIHKMLADLDEDAREYSGDAKWDAYVTERRKNVELLVRMSGFTLDQVMRAGPWPTFGKYISDRQPGGGFSDHQMFLKRFAHMEWRQYSGLSHGAYEGFTGFLGDVPVGAYFMRDFLPRDIRPNVDGRFDIFLSTHLTRAATVLLCTVTELQAYCRFDGANIDHRIWTIWQALLPLFDPKELYDARYAKLMADHGIAPNR
jgi:hypothetical protein